MNIGATANDFGFLLLTTLLAVAVPMVLIGIAKLIGNIIGIKSGAFPVILMLLIVLGVVFGGSFYIDSAGKAANGRIIKKSESVDIRREGDWQHTFTTTLRYRLDGGTPSGDEFSIDTAEANTNLRLNAAQFDTLHEQQLVPVRLVPLWRSVSVVRLASITTRDLVPLPWLLGGVGLLLFIVLAWSLRKHTLGCGLLVAVVMIAAIVLPTFIIYQQWRAMEDLSAKPLRARATVSAVQRITHIDPFPCYRSCDSKWDTDFDVPQQYDIVQLTFTPQGATDAILAVDAADAGTFNGAQGSRVEVAYRADNPRDAQLIGATHTHHWKNLVTFAATWIGLFVGLCLIVLLFNFFAGRFKRRLANARQQIPR